MIALLCSICWCWALVARSGRFAKPKPSGRLKESSESEQFKMHEIAICINMFQGSSFECSLTQTRASGWFVLTNFLNLSQGWAKCISSIKFAGQVLWWYWWWSDICNVRSAQDSTFPGKHKETKKSNCSERCHKKEMRKKKKKEKELFWNAQVFHTSCRHILSFAL